MKKTGKFATSFVAAVLGMGQALLAHEAHKHAEKAAAQPSGETVTVRGETLDLACYLGHGAKGNEHQKCAKKCLLEMHAPAGLLTAEGTVYLLVPDHKHEKAFKPVAQLAAQQVVVTGAKVTMGGLQGILVEKVEKAAK